MSYLIHKRPELKRFRKKLRNEGTRAEAVLWTHLKKRQLGGYKFRRQHSIGRYIVDFYCPKKRLAVELDGAYHFTAKGKFRDRRRDAWLNQQGITVLRYENRRVFEDPAAVLTHILCSLEAIGT